MNVYSVEYFYTDDNSTAKITVYARSLSGAIKAVSDTAKALRNREINVVRVVKII